MNPVISWVAVSAEALLLALGHLITGLNYYRAGQLEQAAHEFQIILERHPNSPVADDALYWNARALEESGHTDQAAALRARLAQMFPHSPYCHDTPTNAASATAPTPLPASTDKPTPTEPISPPPAARTPPAEPAASQPLRLLVRAVRGITVAQFDGQDHSTIPTLRAALVERRQRQPDLTLAFRREADVDLQMVIDVINLLDELGLKYRIEP
ncbi:MAG: tetratricopeptide repeat protein [Verrucomicrobiae bacterium]|nr:tetratricopeptide repeat protein [Verrucomicrobiae bacterium]